MKSRAALLLLSKRELEEYGRTIGIELDRRKTKTHLIEELMHTHANGISHSHEGGDVEHSHEEWPSDRGFALKAASASATVSIPDIDSVPIHTVKAASNLAVDTASEITSKYDLVRNGDFWTVSLKDKEVYKSPSEDAAKLFMEKNS